MKRFGGVDPSQQFTAFFQVKMVKHIKFASTITFTNVVSVTADGASVTADDTDEKSSNG